MQRQTGLYRPETPPAPKYLLVKGLPTTISEEAVRAVFHDLFSIKAVHLCPKSKNVYIHLGDPSELCRFVAQNEQKALSFNGQTLRLSKVSKVPLDLNGDSLVVLLTIYDPQLSIDVHSLHRFLLRWGNAAKIAIYRKKDFQAFVEFRDLDTANRFVEEADNRVFEGLFRLRVKFTRKDHLIIKANSNMEFDFLRAEAQSGWQEPVHHEHLQRQFGMKPEWEQEVRFGQPQQRQPGLVSSYQEFGAQPFRFGQPRDRRHPSMSQTSFHDHQDWERRWDAEIPSYSREEMEPQNWFPDYGYDDQDYSYNEPARHQEYRPPVQKPAARKREPKRVDWLDSEDSKLSDINSQSKASKTPPFSHAPSQPSFQTDPPARISSPADSLIKSAPMHAIAVSSVPAEMHIKHLFNLFSLYGNIPRIYLNPDTHRAFVLYSSEFEQKNAFFHLNNVPVFRAKLGLQPVSNWLTEFDHKGTIMQNFKNSVHFSPDKYPERVRVITCPAPALYVFNLTGDLNLTLLTGLFQKLSPVLQIEYLNDSQVSALVYFENIERATTALCTFKNFKMLVKGLKINFANEKKVWQRAQPHVLNRWKSQGVVPRSESARREARRKESALWEDEEGGLEEEAKDTVHDPVDAGVAKGGKRRFSRLSTASGDKLGSG